MLKPNQQALKRKDSNVHCGSIDRHNNGIIRSNSSQCLVNLALMHQSLMAVEFGTGDLGWAWTRLIGNTVLPCLIIAFEITKSLSYKAVDPIYLTTIQLAVVRQLIQERKLQYVYHEA